MYSMPFRKIARIAWIAPALAVGFVSPATSLAQEITVKNDSLPDNPSDLEPIGFQVYFNAGEEVNVWLTAPCLGTITAIQVLWGVSGQGQGQVPVPSVEDSITLYQPGNFPTRSNQPLLNQFPTPNTPAELVGPAMTGNGLHEFRFIDEAGVIPLSVPVTAGQRFVVSFKFGNNYASGPGPDTPTIPIDTNGAVAGGNGIFGIPGGFLCWGSPSPCGTFNLPGAGDFIVRVKMLCQQQTGACCLPNGQCLSDQTLSACQSQGGTFQGSGTTCGQVNCPQPTGACCVNGNCSIQTETNCAAAGGTFLGAGTSCTGASCNGACCTTTNNCVFTSQANCNAAGGSFHGPGTNCGTVVCNPMGACCLESGVCLAGPMTPAQCEAQGGIFLGNGSTCPSAQCVPPVGACCLGDTCLTDLTQADCELGFGGVWAGPNTACGKSTCPVCFADIDDTGEVDVNDLIAVILAWGPCANCREDIAPAPFGNNQVDVDDLIGVILSWGPCS